MDNQAKWLELECTSIPFMKHCYATYTPSAVRTHERAIEILMKRRPDLPFRSEDLFGGGDCLGVHLMRHSFAAKYPGNRDETRWTKSTRKQMQICVARFGRWAEGRVAFDVLQS